MTLLFYFLYFKILTNVQVVTAAVKTHFVSTLLGHTTVHVTRATAKMEMAVQVGSYLTMCKEKTNFINHSSAPATSFYSLLPELICLYIGPISY